MLDAITNKTETTEIAQDPVCGTLTMCPKVDVKMATCACVFRSII